MAARVPTFSDLIWTVVHFYHWRLDDVLQGMTCAQFWSALDFLIQYRHDEADANRADPMGALTRQMTPGD